jgi:hypothetical protein
MGMKNNEARDIEFRTARALQFEKSQIKINNLRRLFLEATSEKKYRFTVECVLFVTSNIQERAKEPCERPCSNPLARKSS